MSEKTKRINATGKTEEEKKATRKAIEKKNNEAKKMLYDRKSITAPIKTQFNDRVKEAAIKRNISDNQYIIEAVEKQLTADGYPAPTGTADEKKEV